MQRERKIDMRIAKGYKETEKGERGRNRKREKGGGEEDKGKGSGE